MHNLYDAQLIRCTTYTMHNLYDAQLIRCTTYTMHNLYDAQLIRCTTYTMHNLYDAQLIRCTTYTMHNLYDAQLIRCTTYTMHNLYDAQQLMLTIRATVNDNNKMWFVLIIWYWTTWVHEYNQQYLACIDVCSVQHEEVRESAQMSRRPSNNQLTLDVVLLFSSTAQR